MTGPKSRPAAQLLATLRQVRLCAEAGKSSHDTANELKTSVPTVLALAHRHGITFREVPPAPATVASAPKRERGKRIRPSESTGIRGSSDWTERRASIARTIRRDAWREPEGTVRATGLFWPAGCPVIGPEPLPKSLKTCIVCRCTEHCGCPVPCSWVGPALCSHCEEILRVIGEVCAEPRTVGAITREVLPHIVAFLVGRIVHVTDEVGEKVAVLAAERMVTSTVIRRALEQLVADKRLVRLEGPPIVFQRGTIKKAKRKPAAAPPAPTRFGREPKRIQRAVARVTRGRVQKSAPIGGGDRKPARSRRTAT
jgi:hypothetical protein